MAIEPCGYLAEGTNPFAKIKERTLAAKPPKYVSAEEFNKVFKASKNLWWKTSDSNGAAVSRAFEHDDNPEVLSVCSKE